MNEIWWVLHLSSVASQIKLTLGDLKQWLYFTTSQFWGPSRLREVGSPTRGLLSGGSQGMEQEASPGFLTPMSEGCWLWLLGRTLTQSLAVETWASWRPGGWVPKGPGWYHITFYNPAPESRQHNFFYIHSPHPLAHPDSREGTIDANTNFAQWKKGQCHIVERTLDWEILPWALQFARAPSTLWSLFWQQPSSPICTILGIRRPWSSHLLCTRRAEDLEQRGNKGSFLLKKNHYNDILQGGLEEGEIK